MASAVRGTPWGTSAKLRHVITRICNSVYRTEEELRLSPDYFKGRFMIALYEGDAIAGIFQNAKEMTAKTEAPKKKNQR